ncbi:hypothetical protein ILYODFUR_012819 [Ilyodon furcidens]|uniref:Laminin EGF-like domain-containing protein n=1 Tax=Ilyodon furcidens TaxID=33524 RepID=A0ABV0UTS8_9TELE
MSLDCGRKPEYPVRAHACIRGPANSMQKDLQGHSATNSPPTFIVCSGICTCKTGVYGPKCDECHPGFFHFSNTGCRPCQCNNHTNYCHPQSV